MKIFKQCLDRVPSCEKIRKIFKKFLFVFYADYESDIVNWFLVDKNGLNLNKAGFI